MVPSLNLLIYFFVFLLMGLVVTHADLLLPDSETAMYTVFLSISQHVP